MAALEELESWNITAEITGLRRMEAQVRRGEPLLKSQKARLLLLEGVTECAINDPDQGDFISPALRLRLRKAGELLNEEGGMQVMNDGLVWAFIPNRYRRDIDCYWDGIGEWLA